MQFLLQVAVIALVLTTLASTDNTPVTCTSVIKLENVNERVRLHSHDVKYGSGSGQQSVTGVATTDDVNSHWQILGPIDESCERGTPVECGSTIRLLHLTTHCYLHSHEFPAPLSRGNQVVDLGKGGESSDTGDHFKVVCNDDVWLEEDEIRLKHAETGKYLATSGQEYGRPISGQKEIVAVSSPGYSSAWTAAEGIYIKAEL